MSYELTEKIYYSKNDDFSFLDSFMEEVISRRKMNEEGGLQAGIVILKDRVGAKVCDDDGLASHQQSFINVIRFLKGEMNFVSPREVSFYLFTREDQNEMVLNGIEVRIISNLEEIQFLIFAHMNMFNEYQIQCLNTIIEIVKKIQEQNIYQSVNIGISTEEISKEYGVFTDEFLQKWNRFMEQNKSRRSLV